MPKDIFNYKRLRRINQVQRNAMKFAVLFAVEFIDVESESIEDSFGEDVGLPSA